MSKKQEEEQVSEPVKEDPADDVPKRQMLVETDGVSVNVVRSQLTVLEMQRVGQMLAALPNNDADADT